MIFVNGRNLDLFSRRLGMCYINMFKITSPLYLFIFYPFQALKIKIIDWAWFTMLTSQSWFEAVHILVDIRN